MMMMICTALAAAVDQLTDNCLNSVEYVIAICLANSSVFTSSIS